MLKFNVGWSFIVRSFDMRLSKIFLYTERRYFSKCKTSISNTEISLIRSLACLGTDLSVTMS
uniref:Uncharacterized protein n=1 Tax=Rhizophora mucronata TaxID=61149 RepID=A0A2P2QBT6_RHIMU